MFVDGEIEVTDCKGKNEIMRDLKITRSYILSKSVARDSDYPYMVKQSAFHIRTDAWSNSGLTASLTTPLTTPLTTDYDSLPFKVMHAACLIWRSCNKLKLVVAHEQI